MFAFKEKYRQLCLACGFGGINTIGFTQTLNVMPDWEFKCRAIGGSTRKDKAYNHYIWYA
jgi:hypothetical protein